MRFLAAAFLASLTYGLQGCKTPNSSAKTSLAEQIDNPRYVRNENRPWVLWQWNLGSRADSGLNPVLTFVDQGKAIIGLDNARLELIQNNLFDTNGALGDAGTKNSAGYPIWAAYQGPQTCGSPTMDNPNYRSRSIDGKCNDFYNPLLGAAGEAFGRNIALDAVNTAQANFAANGLSDPDPRVISSALMRRKDPTQYMPAPYFNMWGAAWIQFMVHDWISHTNYGKQDTTNTFAVDESTLPPDQQVGSGGVWTVASTLNPQPLVKGGRTLLAKTFTNYLSPWWDGNQLYGYDADSRARVRSGPYIQLDDNKLLPVVHYDAFQADQEAAGYAENWWLGLGLLHTLFSREHNYIVDQLRANAKPPSGAATWSDDELFETARLAVTAVIAKIHSVEWTPQLLFNAPLSSAMNANWYGLAGNPKVAQGVDPRVRAAAIAAVKAAMNDAIDTFRSVGADNIVSLSSAGPGIIGLHRADQFGVPYTLTEEFTSVYRLHAMLPDFMPVYDAKALASQQLATLTTANINQLSPTTDLTGAPAGMVPLLSMLRGGSHQLIGDIGIDDWALTFGMVGAGQSKLNNFPNFMTALPVPTAVGGKVDMAAMDILRDRERGVPRFNEFRRQIHLKPLVNFDDFIDAELQNEITTRTSRDYSANPKLSDAEVAAKQAELDYEKAAVANLKAVYGGDIEKVDLNVGILAEFSRPHGFVISETQFELFILTASRRLFADRFFTEAFTPKFYTQWGFDYVNNTGMVDIMKRQFPNLAGMLNGVENPFDLWSRQRDGYSLDATPRTNMFQ